MNAANRLSTDRRRLAEQSFMYLRNYKNWIAICGACSCPAEPHTPLLKGGTLLRVRVPPLSREREQFEISTAAVVTYIASLSGGL